MSHYPNKFTYQNSLDVSICYLFFSWQTQKLELLSHYTIKGSLQSIWWFFFKHKIKKIQLLMETVLVIVILYFCKFWILLEIFTWSCHLMRQTSNVISFTNVPSRAFLIEGIWYANKNTDRTKFQLSLQTNISCHFYSDVHHACLWCLISG